MQVALLHTWLVPHGRPQPPQSRGSEVTSTHSPAQSWRPAGHDGPLSIAPASPLAPALPPAPDGASAGRSAPPASAWPPVPVVPPGQTPALHAVPAAQL